MNMIITRELVAQKLFAHLQHELSLSDLVNWAEDAIMDADFEPDDQATVQAIVGRLGVADVRAFGLSWQESEEMLQQLGFTVRLEMVAA